MGLESAACIPIPACQVLSVNLRTKGMAPDTLTPCKIRAPSASSEVLRLLATLDPARSVSVTAATDGAAHNPCLHTARYLLYCLTCAFHQSFLKLVWLLLTAIRYHPS